MKAGTKSPITEVFWFLHFLCVEKVKKERFGLAEKTGRGIDRFFEDSIIFGRPWQNSSGKDKKTASVWYIQALAVFLQTFVYGGDAELDGFYGDGVFLDGEFDVELVVVVAHFF